MLTGELARNAKVNLQTIRFYERQGLLPEPARTAAGYRSYEQRHLERVAFIKHNQELGFTLAEIKQLLDIHVVLAAMGPKPFRRRPGELQDMIEIGRERLLAINQKIRSLSTMRRQLQSILQRLETARVVACPAQPAKKRPATRPEKSS